MTNTITADYTATLSVSQSPEEVFNAVNNVPGWWTKKFEGSANKVGDTFTVSFGETYITCKVTESIPGKKVAWLVIDCYKHFLKDKKEWVNTKMEWEIATKDGATQITFTHIGLKPGIECYTVCERAWDSYINQSFLKLVTASEMAAQDFTTTIVVAQTPERAFNAINNVRGWWSQEIDGNTSKLNDEFTYHYKDVHICRMKLIEVIPNQKVVWLVMENYFNFTKDKSEWKGTKISFEITEMDGKTEVRFIHIGLVPEYECFDICQNAWSKYIGQSLRDLITTGKGQPNPIEEVVNQAAVKAADLQ